MSFSPVSWIAIAVMLAAVAAGWSRRFPAVGALLVANIVVFALTQFGPLRHGILNGPAGPIEAVKGELALWGPNLWPATPLGALQSFTSMFVHDGFFHIFGNMLFLFAFGVPFEERIGHRRFLGVYLLGGLAGTLLQLGIDVAGRDAHLMLGASGAIAAIMGAFAVRFPNQVVNVPVPLFIISIFMRVRVVVGVLAFVGLQVVYVAMALMGLSAHDNTGYAAHFGGLAAGLALGLVLVKPGRSAGPVAVDLKALGPFARDATTRQVLDHIQANHDEPAVFQAWLDRFFRTATCPSCGKPVSPRARGEVVCAGGHKFDIRKGRAVAPV